MAKFTHKLIAKTAKEMAACAYEEWAHDDLFYKLWPNQKLFVAKNWKDFVRIARASLAQMLSGNYPEIMKEEILDALIKDRSLPQGGDTTVTVPTVH